MKRALPLVGDLRDPRASSRLASFGLHVVFMLVSLGFSYIVQSRMGTTMLALALVGVFLGTLYAVISFKSLVVPFTLWILSIGGFRYLWSIQTPVLPDLFLDRMMMIWLFLIFMVKFFATGKSLRGPHRLDLLILANGLYLFVRVYIQDSEFMHSWTMSYLVPYAAYFFAKNIVAKNRDVRVFFWALLALIVYYDLTSLAEKFKLYTLIYPKIIISEATRFSGRSVGPFLHAPLFGTIIGMMLPIHLYFIATIRNNLWKILLVISMLLGFGSLYFTYTRGSWLAGIAALGTVAILNRRHYLRIMLPAAIFVPLLAFSVLGAGNDSFMKKRVENEDTLGSRVGTALTALKVWRDNPFLGVGFFQFRKAREDYIQPMTVPGLGTIRFIQFRHNNIHDIYLGPLAEDGLVGFVMQFGIYFLILKTFLLKFRWRNKGDPFAIYVMPILAGIFVGYLVGGLAIDYRFFSFVGTLFYMSAGILEGYQLPENTDVS